MRPEVKHFIYSGLINPANTSDNLVYDPSIPAFGQTTGYLDSATNLTSLTTKSNFIMVFRPDYCLPQNEGTGDDQIIGNKYNWKNTLIELDITPNVGLLNIMHNPFGSDAGKFAYITTGTRIVDGPHTLTTPTYTADLNLSDRQVRMTGNNSGTLGTIRSTSLIVNHDSAQDLDRIAIGNPSNVLTGNQVLQFSVTPYNSGTNYNVQVAETGDLSQSTIDFPQVTSTIKPSTGTHNDAHPFFGPEQMEHILKTDDGEIWTAYNAYNTGIPMYMAPSYKPYFYCRLIFFKFHFGLSDYSTFVTNQSSQSNFLNSLWFDRNNNNDASLLNTEHSVRSNDFAVDNPFGGSFDIIYNKLIKVNPFKEYRFRLNLQSKSKYGDLITISTPNPYLTPNVNVKLLKGAQYFGFLLPPTSLHDFDPVLQKVIYSSSIYNPTTHKRIGEEGDSRSMITVNFETSPYVGPYPQNFVSYNGERLGGRLRLTSSMALRTRTAYTDS